MRTIPKYDSLRSLLSTLRDLQHAKSSLRVVNLEAGGAVFAEYVLGHLDHVTECVTEAVCVELEQRNISASKKPWDALNRQP
jgi:hypothetical protein